jgi:SAM-dependent methyltransferase
MPGEKSLSSVAEHYERLLAPIYLWMAGGMDAAIARGRAEVHAVCAHPANNQWALDLGAGFGMHAMPLADMGYSVVAIDTSAVLLEVLRRELAARSIKIIRDDLTSFKRHITVPPALIVCMGDTLTHLPDLQSVEGLFADVAHALKPGGSFVLAFRDYSIALNGAERFIPVRSDADRILTCFLEYGDGAVTVHDILHERDGAGWRQCVGAYRKLRLSTGWVVGALESKGFQVRHEPGIAGMTRVIAMRPA